MRRGGLVGALTPEGKVNVTDPDSRNVKTPRGWVQGYNAQAACNENQTGPTVVPTASIATGNSQIGPLPWARSIRATW